jgi:hypothetical protein
MWATTGQSDGHAWRVALGMAVWVVVLAGAFTADRSRIAVRGRAAQPIASLGAAGR